MAVVVVAAGGMGMGGGREEEGSVVVEGRREGPWMRRTDVSCFVKVWRGRGMVGVDSLIYFSLK